MIGVVAHDPGGAEFLSSYLRYNPQPFVCCVEGPAHSVFTRKLGKVESLPLELLVDTCTSLLCGTSSVSDLEWRGLRLATSLRKRTISALDHWIGYRRRFLRGGEWCFPSEIWVSDEAALGLARQELPEVKSLTIKDCFFQDIRDEIASIEAPKRGINEGVNILFVSEPIREGGLVLHGDERYWGFTEEEALRYFLTNLGRLFDRVNRIVIRSHPKESRDKYVWTLSEFDLPIIVSEDLPLLHQIVASDVVVGCATMAMAIAVLAEKRVISCIPPGGRLSPPPHAEIKEMRSLLA